MDDLVLLPDVEQVVSTYLRTIDAIRTIVDDRVFTEIPSDPTFPLVRITRLPSGALRGSPRWGDRALLQFDFYGGPKKLAHTLGQTVLAALDRLAFIGVHENDDGPVAVVTGVEFGQFGWLADAAYEPAKPRYVSTVAVYSHPPVTVADMQEIDVQFLDIGLAVHAPTIDGGDGGGGGGEGLTPDYVSGYRPDTPTDYSGTTEYSAPDSGRPSAGDVPGPNWAWGVLGCRYTGEEDQVLEHVRFLGPIFNRTGFATTFVDAIVDARTAADGGVWTGTDNVSAVDCNGGAVTATDSSFFYTINPAAKGPPVYADDLNLTRVELWGGSLGAFPTSGGLIDACWSHHRQMDNVHGDFGCHVNHFYFSGGVTGSTIRGTLMDYRDLVDLAGTSEPNGVTSNVFFQGSGDANVLDGNLLIHANTPGIGNGGDGGIQPAAIVNQDCGDLVLTDNELDVDSLYNNRTGSDGTVDIAASHGNHITGGAAVPVGDSGAQSPPITELP